MSHSTGRSCPRLEELDPRIAPANDLFLVPGAAGAATTVRFDYVSRGSDMPSEIGVFRVDDGLGRVGGLAPGSPGYTAAVLARAQTLFPPAGGPGAHRELSFTGGSLLAVYLIPGGTTAMARAGAAPVLSSLDAANPDRFDHVRAGFRADRGLDFAFEDLVGGGDRDFDDAVIAVGGTRAVATPGQTGQTVAASFTRVSAESDFRSEVGFFLVDAPDGRVGNVRPGDPGYAAAALRSATRQMLFTGFEGDGAGRTVALPSGRHLAFYVVANGSAAQLLASNPNNVPGAGPLAYFSFPEANPDHLDHIRWISPTEFEVEDQFGGGDGDFDDVVVRFAFGPPLGTPTPTTPPTPPDTTPPAAATLLLAPGSDTGTQGDSRTGVAAGILTGVAEAGATVELRRITGPGRLGALLGTTTASTSNGSYSFNNVALAVGSNGFGVVVVDAAGNRSTVTPLTVVRALGPTVTDGDIADQTTAVGQTLTFNLLDVFDTLARFETSEGDIDINLFESRVATVENFLRYVNNPDSDGSYDGSIFHRLDKGFVLQGGGFKFHDAGTTTATAFPPVEEFPPVVNEPGISNTRGTIAMAKLGGDPNSATNEFFFNLADNGGVAPNGLDFQNGGFTVFGELTASGQQVVDQIETTFQEFNGPGLPGAAPFPVRPGAATANFPANITAADLARIFHALTLTDARSLTFSAPTSTSAAVATAAIAGNTLTVTALKAGTTTISFTATSTDGLSATVSFDVTVS